MNNNQKGFVLAGISITLAILGLVGTGAFVNIDHQKSVSHQRDAVRQADVLVIRQKLADYYTANQKYPIQKNQADNGQAVLKTDLGDIPVDPLTGKGWFYWYWSNGQSYTLRHLSEISREEKVLFSE